VTWDPISWILNTKFYAAKINKNIIDCLLMKSYQTPILVLKTYVQVY